MLKKDPLEALKGFSDTEKMESEFERQMGEICVAIRDHPLLTNEGDTTAENVKLLLDQYREALHDAIARPMGVVPASADDLYDQRYYENIKTCTKTTK